MNYIIVEHCYGYSLWERASRLDVLPQAPMAEFGRRRLLDIWKSSRSIGDAICITARNLFFVRYLFFYSSDISSSSPDVRGWVGNEAIACTLFDFCDDSARASENISFDFVKCFSMADSRFQDRSSPPEF
jgi:hypothetical protein